MGRSALSCEKKWTAAPVDSVLLFEGKGASLTHQIMSGALSVGRGYSSCNGLGKRRRRGQLDQERKWEDGLPIGFTGSGEKNEPKFYIYEFAAVPLSACNLSRDNAQISRPHSLCIALEVIMSV